MIHMMQVAQLVPAQVLQQGQGQQDGTPVEADTAAVTATAAAPAAALVPDSDPGDGEAALTGEPLQIGGQQLFCLPAAPVAQQQGGIFRRGSGIEPEFLIPDKGQQTFAAGAQQKRRLCAGSGLAAAFGQRPVGDDLQGRTAQGKEKLFRQDERSGRGAGREMTFQPGQEREEQGRQGRGGDAGRHGQEQALVGGQAQTQIPGPGGRDEACLMAAAVCQSEQDGAVAIEELDGRRSEKGLHAVILPQLLRACKQGSKNYMNDFNGLL